MHRNLLACIFGVVAITISSAENVHWSQLQETFGANAHVDLPFASSCFSAINSVQNTRNATLCANVQANYSNRFVRGSTPGAYMTTQWETCQSTGAACLLDYTDPTNEAAFARNCSQGSVPSGHIEIQSPQDAISAFVLAEKLQIPLVIRNTGHDYKGRSSSPHSIALSTSLLTNLSYTPEFTPEGCSTSYSGVTLGAGVVFQDFYKFAEEKNVTVLGGSDPTVGALGGFIQGGGHSFISNTYGLGVDRVLQFRIVLPTGEYVTANECQNTDLFWALRGGGGGTFGIVLEGTVLASPRVPVQVALVSFAPTQAATRDLWTLVLDKQMAWSRDGWGGLVNQKQALYVNSVLNSTEAADSIQDLLTFGNTIANATVLLTEVPSYVSFFNKFIAPAPAPVGRPEALASRLIPTDQLATSSSRDQLLEALLSAVRNVSDIRIFSTTPFNFVPDNKSATSVTSAWGRSIFHVIINQDWNWNATVSEIRAVYDNLTDSIAMLRSITPPASYQNEGDIHEPDHEVAFWGENYSRLLSIKHRVDPHGLLDCWQCVGWQLNSARYSCYV